MMDLLIEEVIDMLEENKDTRKTAILADSELEQVSGGGEGDLPDGLFEITHEVLYGGCGATFISNVERPERCIICGRPINWDFGLL